jgi:hypothetical protein
MAHWGLLFVFTLASSAVAVELADVGSLVFTLCLLPAFAWTLIAWVRLRQRTALEWSRLAPPRRGLSIEWNPANGYRHEDSAPRVTLDGRRLPATKRRGLFEVRRDMQICYVLVVGQHTITVASLSRWEVTEEDSVERPAATRAILKGESVMDRGIFNQPDIPRRRSLLPLVHTLIRTLDLGRGRLGADASRHEAEAAGVSEPGAFHLEGMDGSLKVLIWGVCGAAVSLVWQGYLATTGSFPLSARGSAIAFASAFAAAFVGPPALMFATIVRLVNVPRLNERAAELVQQTPE